MKPGVDLVEDRNTFGVLVTEAFHDRRHLGHEGGLLRRGNMLFEQSHDPVGEVVGSGVLLLRSDDFCKVHASHLDILLLTAKLLVKQ